MIPAAGLLLAALLFLSFGGSGLKAQVQTVGRFAPYGFSKSIPFEEDVVLEGPQLDNEALLKAALESERPDPITRMRPAQPHKFAEAVDIDVDISEPQHGRWIVDTTNNRRTWRTIIKSSGALSVSLLFSDFYLPDGAELYIIGRDETLGAFTSSINNKPSRKFSTTPLAGDSVILEYHEPLHKSGGGGGKGQQAEPALRVKKVVHGFRATPFVYGQSGKCHIDVACRKSGKTVSLKTGSE